MASDKPSDHVSRPVTTSPPITASSASPSANKTTPTPATHPTNQSQPHPQNPLKSSSAPISAIPTAVQPPPTQTRRHDNNSTSNNHLPPCPVSASLPQSLPAQQTHHLHQHRNPSPNHNHNHLYPPAVPCHTADGKQLTPYYQLPTQPVSQVLPEALYHYHDPHRPNIMLNPSHRNVSGNTTNVNTQLANPVSGQMQLQQSPSYVSTPMSAPAPHPHTGPMPSHTSSAKPDAQRIYAASGRAQGPHVELRGSAYPQTFDGKVLDTVEPYKDAYVPQSQTPTYIQHHHNEFTVGNDRNVTKGMPALSMPQQTYQVYPSSQPNVASVPQHPQVAYHSTQPPPPQRLAYVSGDHGSVIYSDDGQVRSRQDGYDGGDRYHMCGGRNYRDEDANGHGFAVLPPTRDLHYANGTRSASIDYSSSDAFRRSDGATQESNATSATTSEVTRQEGESGSRHPKGWYGSLVNDSLRMIDVHGGGNSVERGEFVKTYSTLVDSYEEKFEEFCDSIDRTVVSLICKARIPYLMDTVTAPVDDETPEDADEKLNVKREFVEAMEKLQGDQLPTKRRGNLPKESTAMLRRWFEDHFDHPYPSDEEKLQLSKQTGIAVQQISHWFINHRKRKWKPSLPANHPAHNGDGNKRPRKRSRKSSGSSSSG